MLFYVKDIKNLNNNSPFVYEIYIFNFEGRHECFAK